MEYGQILLQGSHKNKANKKLLGKLRKLKSNRLDRQAQKAHDEAFEEIDCLKCANCCKTTSPGMKERDVERLAKHLRERPSAVIEAYMVLDSDGDYVFKSAPCPFLGGDNYCSVYEARPNACREYPHTNRKRFHQLLNLTLKNTEICPAAVKVFDRLGELNR
ncbi:MAG: YkgJ family cysteine cluster protein [Flavobacteriales bacterium]|nr:YkgJ family cysteine cluster protein [Flavobacteriales bacterium]